MDLCFRFFAEVCDGFKGDGEADVPLVIEDSEELERDDFSGIGRDDARAEDSGSGNASMGSKPYKSASRCEFPFGRGTGIGLVLEEAGKDSDGNEDESGQESAVERDVELFKEGAALELRFVLPAATFRITRAPRTGGDPLTLLPPQEPTTCEENIFSLALPTVPGKEETLASGLMLMEEIVVVVSGFNVSSESRGVPTPIPMPWYPPLTPFLTG